MDPPALPGDAVTSSTGEALLQVSGVSIEFGGLRALTDFNLEVRRGDLKGLIGPNGAGKTTAFNVLTGVYRPSRGEVRVRGQLVNGMKPHQINRLGLARTFQNIRLFKELTALENVKVGCLSDAPALIPRERVEELRRSRARKLLANLLEAVNNYYEWWRAILLTPGFVREEAAITRRAEEFLEVMGLSHRRNEEARNLPYGEQRRLEIARALATNPKVLLLDEPAAGMNTREKGDLMVLIRNLKDRFSLGILLIEHDMRLVMGICEDITVLDHGETIARGSPADVRSNRKVIEAYLGEKYAEAHARAPAQPDEGPA
jgi:branched-chain amino acid transport system ATP-binding protein